MIRESVRKFYDSYGWKVEKGRGEYQNEILYASPSDVAQKRSGAARYFKYFENGGRFFLDAGCGAKPQVEMGQKFQRHVCADLSLVGIIEARKKLGDRGLYVVADLSNLPFKDQVFDGVVASYCLYQLEKDSQYSALKEFYRVIRAKKNVLVFYVSKYSLVFTAHRIAKALAKIWHSLSRLLPKRKGSSSNAPPFLYFCVENPYRLSRDFPSVDITCSRTLTRVESLVLHKLGLLGLATRFFAFLEGKFPHAMLWVGSYAAIRIQKAD